MSKLKYSKKFIKESNPDNIQEELVKNKFDYNYNTKTKKLIQKNIIIIIGLLENTQRILRIYPHQMKTFKKAQSQIISLLIKIVHIT